MKGNSERQAMQRCQLQSANFKRALMLAVNTSGATRTSEKGPDCLIRFGLLGTGQVIKGSMSMLSYETDLTPHSLPLRRLSIPNVQTHFNDRGGASGPPEHKQHFSLLHTVDSFRWTFHQGIYTFFEERMLFSE